jgi:hypothetical protein
MGLKKASKPFIEMKSGIKSGVIARKNRHAAELIGRSMGYSKKESVDNYAEPTSCPVLNISILAHKEMSLPYTISGMHGDTADLFPGKILASVTWLSYCERILTCIKLAQDTLYGIRINARNGVLVNGATDLHVAFPLYKGEEAFIVDQSTSGTLVTARNPEGHRLEITTLKGLLSGFHDLK